MELAAAIVIAVTLVLGIFAALCAFVGVVFWLVERTRFLGPFVTLIPPLAMIGAVGGSWALGLLVAARGPEFHGHAYWAWLLGLFIGGALGGSLAVLLALCFHRKGRSA